MTDDLVTRLREYRIGCGIHCSAYDAREPLDECIEAADRIEELEQLFDLRWAADMRAIKAWQIAHPDQPRTWPDHADLGVWCLSRIEKLEATLQMVVDWDNTLEFEDSPAWGDVMEVVQKALEGKDD